MAGGEATGRGGLVTSMAITRRRDGAQLHDADDQRRRAPADAQLSQAARRETHDRDRAA